MIGWIISDRMHKKSSAQKVIHPNTILALGCLKVHGIRVKALGLNQPLCAHTLGVQGCSGGFNVVVVVHKFVLSLSHLVYELLGQYLGGLEYLHNGHT